MLLAQVPQEILLCVSMDELHYSSLELGGSSKEFIPPHAPQPNCETKQNPINKIPRKSLTRKDKETSTKTLMFLKN